MSDQDPTQHAGDSARPGGDEFPGPRRRRARALLHALGLCAGLALLGWCVAVALNPDNRAQLRMLREADWRLVALLALLSAASLLANGLAFWVVLRPVRRIPVLSVLAVNALATALASIPFKLSVLCRFVVHHRRDGVPLLIITTWMGNMLLLIVATMAPLVLVSVVRGRVDAAWFAGAGGGVIAAALLICLVARAASRGAWWAALERRWNPRAGASRPGVLRRLVQRFAIIDRAREGVRALSSPTAVFSAAGLRCADVVIQAARFVVAAAILQQTLSPADAIIAAATYFLVGVASPAGALGFREAAVVGVAGASGAADVADPVAAGSIVVLTVTAIDTVVVLLAAGAAAAYLRIDRLLAARDLDAASDAGAPRAGVL
ncbi:MAG: lysylphosphatidylglycerol synthase domain-containing protein [Phycisphaerales bacterium]